LLEVKYDVGRRTFLGVCIISIVVKVFLKFNYKQKANDFYRSLLDNPI